MLIILAAYFQPFNTAFGTRDNIYMHFGTPAIPFALVITLVDETRKYFIRNLQPDKNGKPHWFVRAALW
jgi:sodium/potassium-transporting ATPase subunit alpha